MSSPCVSQITPPPPKPTDLLSGSMGHLRECSASSWVRMRKIGLNGCRFYCSQASTGFFPFELLFSRQPRGVLDVLREEWETFLPGSESPSAHLATLQSKLKHTACLVQEELTRSQDRQKRRYDKAVQPHSFNPSQRVLLLLTSSENKLLMEWQDPFKVTQRVGDVND